MGPPSQHLRYISVKATFSGPQRTGKHPATHWEVCEIFCALFSSLITTTYTLHHNESHGISLSKFEQQILAFDLGPFSVIFDPPPAMVLVFCLFLGCSVSSFTYRRQQDKFQTLIFLFITTAAITMGWALGKNANLIMLELIPWGLCFAMALSCMLHWLLERRSRKIGYVYEMDSKEGV